MRTTCLLAAAFVALAPLSAGEWPQFRGVNSSGVSDEKNLPIFFGSDQNMVWRTPLPPGHSSPVFSRTQIFVSAYDKDGIYLIALDRRSGRENWRRTVPRPRVAEHHKASTPASPSPVTDGTTGTSLAALLAAGGTSPRALHYADTHFEKAKRASVWTADRQCQKDMGSSFEEPDTTFVDGCFDRKADPTFLTPVADVALTAQLDAEYAARMAELAAAKTAVAGGAAAEEGAE